MKKASLVARVFFALAMLVTGSLDLLQPDEVLAAMDALSLPHYMALILGVAKIAGGLVLLAPAPLMIKEWAYAGCFIWWLGALSCHGLSGHALPEFVPVLVLGGLLIIAFLDHKSTRMIVGVEPGATHSADNP